VRTAAVIVAADEASFEDLLSGFGEVSRPTIRRAVMRIDLHR
jgi:hypothetical protein